MRTIRQGSVVWFACLLWCGCAHTARVTYWRPAELNEPGMQRLAVAPFVGDHGDEISRLLESRLWEEDVYTVADRSELGPPILAAGFFAEGVGDPRRLQSAAQLAGIDGIILGEVREYGVYTANSQSAESLQPITDSPDRGARVRSARVSLDVRLIDSRTGEVCAARQISRESTPRSGAARPEDEQHLLNALARDCLEEFMGVLAPQSATAEVELAPGDWYRLRSRDVRRGIRLARQGHWDDAEMVWEQVLDRDPANHAALYNLAVAAGQRQDFVAAEDYALRALREHHTDCYARGLDQLRQFRAESDRIARQRQAQIVQASLAAAQD